MTTMITEVYEAFNEAGASDEKAKAAAEAIADFGNKFSRIESKLETLEAKFDSESKIIKSKIDSVETKLNSRIEIIDKEINLLKWMLGFVIAGIVSMVIKLFI